MQLAPQTTVQPHSDSPPSASRYQTNAAQDNAARDDQTTRE